MRSRSFLGAGVSCAALLLAACATPSGTPADYGLGVAADLQVPGSQGEVAACLRKNENSASYPQGVSPGYTATEADGSTLRMTQWFYLKRGATWATRFELRPLENNATRVQVLLPEGFTASQSYQRAAVEVITRCQAILARAPR